MENCGGGGGAVTATAQSNNTTKQHIIHTKLQKWLKTYRIFSMQYAHFPNMKTCLYEKS